MSSPGFCVRAVSRASISSFSPARWCGSMMWKPRQMKVATWSSLKRYARSIGAALHGLCPPEAAGASAKAVEELLMAKLHLLKDELVAEDVDLTVVERGELLREVDH